MQYLRIYSEKNGDSRFAETELAISEPDYQPPAPTLFVSHTYDSSGLQFVRLPGGWTGEALHPPSRQFVICVDGHLEVTASDGEKRSFGPGDCLLMEDVDGKGHRSHVRAGHDCVIGVIAIH
jgi:hypothetical protein